MEMGREIREAAGRAAARTGALAAELLERACEERTARGASLRVEEVRRLSHELRAGLEAIADPDGGIEEGLLAEAALRCADLANLAASSAGAVHPGVAGAVAHLCAGAAGALRAAMDLAGETGKYALGDARSALWRVELAVRQVGVARG